MIARISSVLETEKTRKQNGATMFMMIDSADFIFHHCAGQGFCVSKYRSACPCQFGFSLPPQTSTYDRSQSAIYRETGGWQAQPTPPQVRHTTPDPQRRPQILSSGRRSAAPPVLGRFQSEEATPLVVCTADNSRLWRASSGMVSPDEEVWHKHGASA